MVHPGKNSPGSLQLSHRPDVYGILYRTTTRARTGINAALLGQLLCRLGEMLPVMEMAVADALWMLLYATNRSTAKVRTEGRNTLDNNAEGDKNYVAVGGGPAPYVGIPDECLFVEQQTLKL